MATIHAPGATRGLPLPLVGPVNWWIVAGIALFAIGAVLPVLQNSAATSRGFQMYQLKESQTRLQSEVKSLESDVANLTALTRIEQRAAVIGLGPSDFSLFVHVDTAGPAPAKIPSQYLPEPAPPPARARPWWRSLLP